MAGALSASLFGGLGALPSVGGFAPSGAQGQSPQSGGEGAKPPEADDISIVIVNIVGLRMVTNWKSLTISF